jgi:hypothetical protein
MSYIMGQARRMAVHTVDIITHVEGKVGAYLTRFPLDHFRRIIPPEMVKLVIRQSSRAFAYQASVDGAMADQAGVIWMAIR